MRVFTGPFAPLGSVLTVFPPPPDVGDAGDASDVDGIDRPVLPWVTVARSSTGRAAFAPSTSSGMVDAGAHSVMPGRHTSVDMGRTLLASAERSSSVRTSR